MNTQKKSFEEGLKSLAERLNLEDLSQTFYFPKYFELETIRACNARCTMCTIPQWTTKGSKMQESLFSKISEEMSHYSGWINSVCLSRNGEPLLDKTLAEKIKILKHYGIKNVTFSTNASLLYEEKARELIESGLDDIRFSVDGATKETFEAVRKGLKYEEVLENCLRFIQLRNERGHIPRVQIRMVLQKANCHEEQVWRDFWKSKVSKNDIVYSKTMASWGNQLDSYEGQKEIDRYALTPCISPWSTLIVHFNGKVPLCGCDFNHRVLLGDISTDSIQKVWQSQEYDNIRRLHASGNRNNIQLCRGCNIWDIEEKKVYNK